MFKTDRVDVWLEARESRVLGDKPQRHVLEGPGYLYRPEQLVVNNEDLHLVAEQLKQVRATVHEGFDRELREYQIPVTIFQVTGVPIPALVARLRSGRAEGSPVPRVGPNHVFSGEPVYQGGPGGEPVPADPPDGLPGDLGGITPETPRVATLDTGVPTDLLALHPDLSSRIVSEGDDDDLLYVSGDILDHEAGHGTFVSGIVMQLAPWLTIDPEKVLNSAGIGDDATVTLGLAKSKCSLTNASLGGYTHDDMPPPVLEAFLAQMDPESLVVAAAGNNSQQRPFWPAAFKHVVAVGAVDEVGGTLTAASFTNSGDWVDCCAFGVGILSTYVRGEWRLAAADTLEPFRGWACWSGTSFAAPQVTAAIARRMHDDGVTARRAAHLVLAEASQHVPNLGFFIKPDRDLRCSSEVRPHC